MASTVDWLRARTDDELAALLAARPDLLLPAPGDLATLARRVDSAASVRRAVAGCDAFAVQLLQAVWICGPAEAASVCAFLGGPASVTEVLRGLERLETLGLVRGDEVSDTPTYALAPSVRESLGRYPAGLGAPGSLDDAGVRSALAGLDEAGLGLLRKLVPGPPVGSIPADSPQRGTVAALLAAGLLAPGIETGAEITVALPREVALALRGEQPLGPAVAAAPEFMTVPQGDIDSAAAGRALAAHARMVALVQLLGEAPLPALKSGGVGVVPLRKLAGQLDVTPTVAALYLELAHGAGLLAAAVTRSGAARWLPTQLADTFLAGPESGGWALMADTWLNMRRDPGRVGDKDAAGATIAALATAADWRAGPVERRRVLGELSSLPAGLGTDAASIAARLTFRAPLAGDGTALVQAVLAEATELGVTAWSALSAPGRALLGGEVPEVAAALEATLPTPVETILVQADMTVIAPGRLARHLADSLAEIADQESAGAGAVYRITEESVRRGLNLGVTAVEMHQLLGQYSSTPIPQAITYLIDDVARRHGVVRVGRAESFVHSEDPALIARAVAVAATAGVDLRLLAPTVAVCDRGLDTVVEVLREFAPAAEDALGTIVSLGSAPQRTRAVGSARPGYSEPSAPSVEQIAAVVRRVRAAAEPGVGPMAARDVQELLKQAADRRETVWISYADAEGGVAMRAVEPVTVSGGSMVAFDRLRGRTKTFSLSRISRAHLDRP